MFYGGDNKMLQLIPSEILFSYSVNICIKISYDL